MTAFYLAAAFALFAADQYATGRRASHPVEHRIRADLTGFSAGLAAGLLILAVFGLAA